MCDLLATLLSAKTQCSESKSVYIAKPEIHWEASYFKMMKQKAVAFCIEN